MEQPSQHSLRPVSPMGATILQKHNLSRAAISLNSMRYEDNMSHPLHRPPMSASVTERCQRLQGKINDIQVSPSPVFASLFKL